MFPILDKIGEARVRTASTAFRDGDRSWSGCFLARAYGQAGEVVTAHHSRRVSVIEVLEEDLGLTATEVASLIAWFLNRPSAMEPLVSEWLVGRNEN